MPPKCAQPRRRRQRRACGICVHRLPLRLRFLALHHRSFRNRPLQHLSRPESQCRFQRRNRPRRHRKRLRNGSPPVFLPCPRRMPGFLHRRLMDQPLPNLSRHRMLRRLLRPHPRAWPKAPRRLPRHRLLSPKPVGMMWRLSTADPRPHPWIRQPLRQQRQDKRPPQALPVRYRPPLRRGASRSSTMPIKPCVRRTRPRFSRHCWRALTCGSSEAWRLWSCCLAGLRNGGASSRYMTCL